MIAINKQSVLSKIKHRNPHIMDEKKTAERNKQEVVEKFLQEELEGGMGSCFDLLHYSRKLREDNRDLDAWAGLFACFPAVRSETHPHGGCVVKLDGVKVTITTGQTVLNVFAEHFFKADTSEEDFKAAFRKVNYDATDREVENAIFQRKLAMNMLDEDDLLKELYDQEEQEPLNLKFQVQDTAATRPARTLTIDRNFSIEQVCEMVAEQLRIRGTEFNLVRSSDNTQLEDDAVVQDYNFSDGEVILVKMRGSGGSPKVQKGHLKETPKQKQQRAWKEFKTQQAGPFG